MPIEIPYRFAAKHNCLVQEQQLFITHLTPVTIIQSIMIEYQHQLTLSLIAIDVFQNKLTMFYQQQKLNLNDDEENNNGDLIDLKKFDLLDNSSDAPIVQLLNNIIQQAINQSASDIHFEHDGKHMQVRFRIDGVLHKIMSIGLNQAAAIISRLKIISNLDIAEKRLPQDGRVTVHIAKHAIDLRISVLPVSHGERVVLRILDRRIGQLSLSELGLAPDAYQQLQQLLANPNGVILVTGPTGSGKSTSLYAALRWFDRQKYNIMTVEDPVEYDLAGISQTPVQPKIGKTFSNSLRAILRQDPDIIMIGEIRDQETAQIAIQASLTGHLVLSTLHTNTAIGAVARLTDMAVEPYLLASSLSGLIAQRLVRRLCEHCKQTYQPQTSLLQQLNMQHEQCAFYKAVGCDQCFGTGFKGRIGIYEIIICDEGFKTLLYQQANEQRLQDYCKSRYRGLQQDGIVKIKQGLTSIEEVLRQIQLSSVEID